MEAVAFEVRGSTYSLPYEQAKLLGEELRRTAAGQLGEHGTDDAREVADAIEAVLTEADEGPVRLSDSGADAVFYMLNVGHDPTDPAHADTHALYLACRRVHDENLRAHGSSSS